jgi:hypothetical protein
LAAKDRSKTNRAERHAGGLRSKSWNEQREQVGDHPELRKEAECHARGKRDETTISRQEAAIRRSWVLHCPPGAECPMLQPRLWADFSGGDFG